MQPLPAKTRTAVMVGAAMLAVIVASVVFWSSRRPAAPDLPADELALLESESGLQPDLPSFPATSANPSRDILTGTPSGTVTATGSAVPPYHIVAPGDTLSSISRQYYKTHIYAGDIEALNQLTEPNVLEVGKQLKLPDPQTLAAAR